MDCSLSVSSVHGIFQARVLEWIAISFSRGSSWPRNRTQVSRTFLITLYYKILNINTKGFDKLTWLPLPVLCVILVLSGWILALHGDCWWRFLHVSWQAIRLVIQLRMMLFLLTVLCYYAKFPVGSSLNSNAFLRPVSSALSGYFLVPYLIDMSCALFLHPIRPTGYFSL